jgi:hypothetical protein
MRPTWLYVYLLEGPETNQFIFSQNLLEDPESNQET